MTTRRRSKSITLLVLLGLVFGQMPLEAHNAPVHQKMTDYAYEVMLAMQKYLQKNPLELPTDVDVLLKRLADQNPELKTLYGDAAKAVNRLRQLPSGLPDDWTPCQSPVKIAALGVFPDWMLAPNTTLAQTELGALRFAVTTDYAVTSSDCGINLSWKPSGVLAKSNPPAPSHRDHTGVTLGYWASTPDNLADDWVFRSTTLKTLQNPAVAASIGVGVSVAVSLACAALCGLMPALCPACPAIAVGAGKDIIDEIDNPDPEHLTDASLFTGLGHFIDMKPSPANAFDEKPGKNSERAGPAGDPDATELIVMAGFDLLGLHVNFDASDAPHHYEILSGGDGHANSVPRTAPDWETATAAHIDFTPVDNLAKFGWGNFVAANLVPGLPGQTAAAHDLAWPLHAFGDATVPMHVVGTSGEGHRPYEDVADMAFDDSMGSDPKVPNDSALSLQIVGKIVTRTLAWRTFIQNWRAANSSTDVPVRDMVTLLAKQTLIKSQAHPDVFNAKASAIYLLVSKSDAEQAYDTPAMAAIQRDLNIDGIAAMLAFLMSATEVVP